MKKSALIMGLLLLVGLGSFIACTKEVDGRPQFIFKPAPDKTSVAKIKGKVITHDELVSGIENDLYEAELKVYELKMNKLRAMTLKRFMEADPAYKGDNDKFLAEQIASKVKVSEKEVNAFVKERKIPKENLNAELKNRIKQFLLKEKKQKAVDSWLAEKTKDSPVEVYLDKPQRPVKEVKIGDSPAMGRSDAAVTIVEFSDFQCPFCARGAKVMDEIKEKYGKKVRVVFKNFPLPFHTHAKKAAQAALCVHEQKAEYFWKLHDKMFADQAGLARDGLVAKAKAIGADSKKFESCLDSNKFQKSIAADMAHGKEIGVKSTPTFFVNGQMVNGAQPLEVFSEIIDDQMSK